jgi:hypothetical protein
MDLKVTTKYLFAFGELIDIRGNVTLEGYFKQLDPSWDESCFMYQINNIAFYSSTDSGPKPPEFPAFLDPTACPSETGGLTQGGWGDVTHITVIIKDCTVPTENITWGAVKALYHN